MNEAFPTYVSPPIAEKNLTADTTEVKCGFSNVVYDITVMLLNIFGAFAQKQGYRVNNTLQKPCELYELQSLFGDFVQ